ncbi:MAG: dTMP kinase [Deltaproteobacteria bacterium]|nr:dTMP kinase [Deltaproteobacteria bacterium]
MPQAKPFFITVEGGDGSGKSTLITNIRAEFAARGVPHLCTREPGGTPVAEEIRGILLKPGRTVVARAELLLYEAARAEHVDGVIRPALDRGVNVLCDRFTHSSIAYQGAARGLPKQLVEMANWVATGGFKVDSSGFKLGSGLGLDPDAVIWLRLSPAEARRRSRGRGDENRLDAEDSGFHERVFAAFEEMSRSSGRFIVLDASQDEKTVFNQLLAHPLWRKMFGSGK